MRVEKSGGPSQAQPEKPWWRPSRFALESRLLSQAAAEDPITSGRWGFSANTRHWGRGGSQGRPYLGSFNIAFSFHTDWSTEATQVTLSGVSTESLRHRTDCGRKRNKKPLLKHSMLLCSGPECLKVLVGSIFRRLVAIKNGGRESSSPTEKLTFPSAWLLSHRLHQGRHSSGSLYMK